MGFTNVSGKYHRSQPQPLDYTNANETATHGPGTGSTDPLNSEAITLDRKVANPSGSDAKATAAQYHLKG